MPTHLVKDFLYKENQISSVEEFINNINYKKSYNNITRFIKSNNNQNKIKLLENTLC